MFLLLALSHLDRMTDPDCGELEHYELDDQIEQLRKLMRPVEVGYFNAILDIVHYAQSIR
jgi:hypothetical protein